MARRYKKKVIKDLEMIDMATKGKALARHNGMVIFVENAVPGDVADVRLTQKKRDYAIGQVLELTKPSELRVTPFCKHFGVCGGCKWQYLSYEQQLIYKQNIVGEAFNRIGKLDFPDLLPILPSEPNQYYRNKMDFTFSNRKWLTNEQVKSEEVFNRDALGFHKPGMFDKIVDIEHCYLHASPSNEIRNEVRNYALEHQLSFYDVMEHQGFLRNLIIRSSTLNEWMVILSLGHDDEKNRVALLDHLLEKFPIITSLHYVINPKKNETLYDLDIKTHHGRGYIYEELEDLKYKISPKSFFQTNPTQAVRLYQTVRDFADLQGHETVFDLYTGTGSIGIFLAKHCKQVVGIEEVDTAIVDAKYNSTLNGLTNTHFYSGDVKHLLSEELTAKHGQADVLITDPPRAGMHKDVVEKLLDLAIPKLVYVSCNPATQARDLQLLAEKYDIKKIQPVDMFPHTYHVENVVLLTLK